MTSERSNRAGLAVTLLIATALIACGVGTATDNTGYGMIAGGIMMIVSEVLFGLIQRWN